ncbi:MAG: TonB-dependent receptor [Bacteroidia bacterium]|nr:TonB-dependent receptor [Bacteroidia bacterium]
MLRHLLTIILFLVAINLNGFSQTLTGTLRGRVLDKTTEEGLSATKITLLTSIPQRIILSDQAGNFRFDSLLVGRHSIKVEMAGYKPFLREDLLVTTQKEVVVNVSLKPSLYNVEQVTLTPDRTRGSVRNEMSSVSALSFEIEETRKFAGGLDDPTRLAGNFPGIVSTPFTSENFISVRGNSPMGLIYRIEGIDIPNPNHFARIGSSGGTFTIFSNQVLSNSDFFIGAFPAEYGNATSGVFDIRFRNGNNQKREYAFQAGVLGVDLKAEGPFKKGGKASYLVNYRLSSLSIASFIINYLTVPTYQDLSFKLHLPTNKFGTFSVFGIGGLSDRFKPTEESNFLRDLDRFQNTLTSDMAVLGVRHRTILKTGSVWETTIAGSYADMTDNRSYLEDTTQLDVLRLRDQNEYSRLPISIASSLKHRFSPQLLLKLGGQYTRTYHDYLSLDYDYIQNRQVINSQEAGNTQLYQAYTQAQWRPFAPLTINGGVHYLFHDLNQKQSLEPRFGMALRIAPKQHVSFGYGLHSRTEQWGTYMTRFYEEGQTNSSLPNLDLDLMKAHHLVIGYNAMLSDNLKFQAEIYHQSLFNVPVEIGDSATYTVLNLDELNELRALNNDGTGRNYGIDMGLERFSRNGFYYMLNGSIFRSTYTDGQGREHSTAYNTGYKTNFLIGKEIKMGKKRGRNAILSLNSNLSIRGGQRYTPIDLQESRLALTTVFDETYPFIEQDKPLVVWDVTVNIFRNRKRFNESWSIQIKNIFQSQAAEYRDYDATLDRAVALEGAGFLPVMSYKIHF